MDAQSPFDLGVSNASVSFRVRWFGVVTVSGRFDAITGTLLVGNDEDDLAVTVDVSSASVKTGIALRDRHLRGRRFLGAERHPVIRFASDRVRRRDDGWEVGGRLSLRGSTRDVHLLVRDEPSSGTVRRLTGEFTVPRQPHDIGVAFGIRRLNPLLWAIGDEVLLRVELLVPATLLQRVAEHAPVR